MARTLPMPDSITAEDEHIGFDSEGPVCDTFAGARRRFSITRPVLDRALDACIFGIGIPGKRYAAWRQLNAPATLETSGGRHKEVLAPVQIQATAPAVIDERRQQKDRLEAIVAAAKQLPCADCGRALRAGSDDVASRRPDDQALSPSHRDDPADALAEIAKCEVLCANCHAIHHAETQEVAS